MNNKKLVTVTALLAATVFAVDLFVPLGVSDWVFYVAVIWSSLASEKPRYTFVVASICTILVVLGGFLSPPAEGIETWKFITNRILALLVVWLTALLIQQQQRSRQAVRQASEQRAITLREKNEQLEQFAHVVSHDLKSPLQVVEYCLAMILRKHVDQLDPQTHDFIERASGAVSRMAMLIDDLLVYALVDSANKLFQPTECELVLDQALANLQTEIDQTNTTVTRDVLPRVVADDFQLMQLFQNLIENAIKYRSSQPPKIHVGCRREGDLWRISVSDNGIGIDPAATERIFNAFERLGTQHEISGTGIGLATCERIVRRHGGRIWADSQLNAGSTFYFTLPILRGE